MTDFIERFGEFHNADISLLIIIQISSHVVDELYKLRFARSKFAKATEFFKYLLNQVLSPQTGKLPMLLLFTRKIQSIIQKITDLFPKIGAISVESSLSTLGLKKNHLGRLLCLDLNLAMPSQVTVISGIAF
jgi:hypothetical protein